MTCGNCIHWQGTKNSTWGDCYRVVMALNPELEMCFISNEYGTTVRNFSVPFDPHDIKYWMDPSFHALYDSMTTETLGNPKIKVEEIVVDDIIYDRENGERVGRLKVKYFQTHKEFECHD